MNEYEQYLDLVRRILNEPVDNVDVNLVKKFLKEKLSTEEIELLLTSEANVNQIFRKLRRRSLKQELCEIAQGNVCPEDCEKKRFILGSKLHVDKGHSYSYVTHLRNIGNCLIIGDPGSGKSVYLKEIMSELIHTASSKTLQFIIVDSKGDEFENLSKLHKDYIKSYIYKDFYINLLTQLNVLKKRRKLFEAAGVKSIEEYNRYLWKNERNCIPDIVFIIEFVDDICWDKKTNSLLLESIKEGNKYGVHFMLTSQNDHPVSKEIENACITKIKFLETSKYYIDYKKKWPEPVLLKCQPDIIPDFWEKII